MKTLAIVLLSSVLGHGVWAGTAEDAWENLVGVKMGKRPEFSYVVNNPELPNVLIYGDSISIGYTMSVREQLAGTANVYRIYCNGGESGSFIPKMQRMQATMQATSLDAPWRFDWDVIHFNVGLHDLKYVLDGALDKNNGKRVSSPAVYKDNLKRIVAYLKKLAPNAKLIFATTTPVPEGAAGRFAGDALRYNKIARETLGPGSGIIINDLYSFTLPNQTTWWRAPGNVHYLKDGTSAQGAEVARCIRQALVDVVDGDMPIQKKDSK